MNKSEPFRLHMGCGESLGGALGTRDKPERSKRKRPALPLRDETRREADSRMKQER